MNESTSATDALLAQNEAYVLGRTATGEGTRHAPPSKRLAIVACMDARLDIYRILGLGEGEAHVIRNAGGVVTDDVLRSLIISQRLLGTSEIVLIHHTECGMLTFDDADFREKIAAEAGYKPPFSFQPFRDLARDVREGMSLIRDSPFLTSRNVRGFICDIATARLEEVR